MKAARTHGVLVLVLVLVPGIFVVATVLAACGSDATTPSPPPSEFAPSDAGRVDTPEARAATICDAQRSFDERCGTSAADVDAGAACALSCFAPLLTPRAASTFSGCTSKQPCGGTTCGLGVPCTEAELCSVQAGKAGLAESGFDVDAAIAKCEAKSKTCQVAFFTDPATCDRDRFIARYGAFTDLPAAIAACYDLACDEIGPCVSKANADVAECQSSN